MENDLENLILEFFKIEMLKFGNFTLKSGVQSPVYFDLRIIISNPKLMDSLTNLLIEVLKTSVKEKVHHVCGVPYTALPVATLISHKTNIPMLIRRREAKDHGTKKIIEGQFNRGDECVVIEDVVSSGSSILETVADLVREGLKVSNAIVVLDREQGGVDNLRKRGIKVHILTSLNKILKILFHYGKIQENVVRDVEQYISKVSLWSKDDGTNYGSSNLRLTMPFRERAKLCKCPLTVKLLNMMESKKTLLCLAADVTTSGELLKLASQTGPHIALFKTHFDIVEDFTRETHEELLKLSRDLNFLIMEDRKFSDIGNTVCLQYGRVKDWSDLVTIHSIAGETILTGMNSCAGQTGEKGAFLVAELSCQGHLMSNDYAKETAKMAEKFSHFVVGLVSQTADLIKVPHLIQLTPGVKVEEGSDGLGQRYNDPEHVVLERGADLAVVGRGIIKAEDPEKTAELYKKRLWEAYLKRIGKMTRQKYMIEEKGKNRYMTQQQYSETEFFSWVGMDGRFVQVHFKSDYLQ